MGLFVTQDDFDRLKKSLGSLPHRVKVLEQGGVGSAATWGTITGTLSSQTDLNTALSGKEPSITIGTTAQYLRGDKSWQTLNKAAVGLSNVQNVDQTSATNITSGTLGAARLGSGTTNNTTFLRGDNTWVSPSSIMDTLTLEALTNDPPCFFTHFIDITGWQISTSSGLINQITVDGRVGLFQLTTGAVATGRSCIFRASQQNTGTVTYAGSGTIEMSGVISVPTLSTSTDEYTVAFGLITNVANPLVSTNIIAFVYDRSANGDFWVARTKNATSTTSTVTTKAVVAGAYSKFRILVNAAGTQVQFLIDDVLLATHTTNIPVGASASGQILIGINKSVGTTSRTILLDSYYEKLNLTTAVV